MTQKQRLMLLSTISSVALIVVIVFGALAFARTQNGANAPSDVRMTPVKIFTGERIEFRNTAAGKDYGVVASVPLADPTSTRSASSQVCDRVYATAKVTMCLRTNAGVVTTWTAIQTGATGELQHTWSLPGVPSRTRVSPDSKLVAETAFITSEEYSTVGFSTQTVIATTAGKSYGTIEQFRLTIDGKRITASDTNVWGVTFIHGDDRYFYATAATAGKTWLVRGDLIKRTLTAIHEKAECPSVSPDGSRVAFKKNMGTFDQPDWRIAVLTLATMTETVLPEKRSVDDQVEWLDKSTLLYGLPRAGIDVDSDVWSIAADGSGTPAMFIQHAWSPSVVRP